MTFIIRPTTPDDRHETFAMFRRSLWAYLQASGSIAPDEEDDLESAWQRQGPLAVHLERTAAEDWVTTDEQGAIIGMARSIERGGHVELTHFFVDPNTQTRGVGRALLEKAFSPGFGAHRSIIATQHVRALGPYLQFGVAVQSVGFALVGRPSLDHGSATDLEFVVADSSDLSSIAAIDREVMGYDRTVDFEFLLSDRPAHLVVRAGETVGYSFSSNGDNAGPAAVRDPDDLTAVMDHWERLAAERDEQYLAFSLSGAAHTAVGHALGRGYQIFPFYEMFLADGPGIQFDRYLMTQPGFMW